LELRVLRFDLRMEGARESLPRFLGSTLRGVLAASFRTLACETRREQCDGCWLLQRCPYAYVFETPVDDQVPAEILSRFDQMPRPYVIRVPREYAGEEWLSVEVVLVGRAGVLVPHLIQALREAGAKGIGARRTARFRIAGATGIEVSPTAAGISMRPCAGLPLTRLDDLRAEGDERVRQVTLDFVTPLRVKKFGGYLNDASRLDFAGLFGLLVHRIEALTAVHCAGKWRAGEELMQAARDVAVKERRLRFKPLWRYSNRHGRPMPLHGLVGSIRFEGDLGPFMPLLRAGEILHVGAGCDLGLGCYRTFGHLSVQSFDVRDGSVGVRRERSTSSV
jgi:hypothetical protein